MIESYKTVYEGGVGEFTMKKSKFIATVKPVETEEEALEFIEELRKKYWNATHNCTAFVVGTKNPLVRFNDDGEPSQTAGKPMLDVLLGQEITNVAVVVTRYFGGTLLGTGGLVKAYQSSTIEGLNQSTIITKKLAYNIEISTDYNTIGKIQHWIMENQLHTLDSSYTDIVSLNVLIPPSEYEGFTKAIADITSGNATIKEIEKMYYAKVNNEIHLFRDNF